jgi:hypothetical protein
MTKYYVEVKGINEYEKYEIEARSRADAEKIAGKGDPTKPFRQVTVQDDIDRNLELAGGAAAVGAIATVLVAKGAWYGVKGGFKLGRKAAVGMYNLYEKSKNRELTPYEIEWRKKAEAEKEKWAKKAEAEKERWSKLSSSEKSNEILKTVLLALFIPSIGLLLLLHIFFLLC